MAPSSNLNRPCKSFAFYPLGLLFKMCHKNNFLFNQMKVKNLAINLLFFFFFFPQTKQWPTLSIGYSLAVWGQYKHVIFPRLLLVCQFELNFLIIAMAVEIVFEPFSYSHFLICATQQPLLDIITAFWNLSHCNVWEYNFSLIFTCKYLKMGANISNGWHI